MSSIDSLSTYDRIRQLYTHITINCKDLIKHLPENEQNGVYQLIEASKLTNPIFVAQASYSGPAALETVTRDLDRAKEMHDPTKCKELEETLHLLNLFGKPYAANTQENFLPGESGTTPPEAAFYPPGTTKEQLDRYLAAHPDQEASLLAIDTVVESDGKGGYFAVPFAQKYSQYVNPMCDHLNSAADYFDSTQPAFAHFLRDRSDALRHNKDLYATDVEWMKLPRTCPIDITIGPIETYEDKLTGQKASYKAVLLIEATDAMEQLQRYRHLMDQMEMALPLDRQWLLPKGKTEDSSSSSSSSSTLSTEGGAVSSSIELYNAVYIGGAGATPSYLFAHNLPNDERVTSVYGNRNQFYLNLVYAKMEHVLTPIANVVIAKEHQKYLRADSFLIQRLLHELAHTLGPSYVHNDPDLSTIRRSLGEVYWDIEECKADALSIFFAQSIAEGVVKESADSTYTTPLLTMEDMKYYYITSFASMFRIIRFGRNDPHAVDATIQLNWLIKHKAALPPPPAATSLGFTIDFERFRDEIRALSAELLEIKLHGDKERAEKLIREYGTDVLPSIAEHLKAIQDLPIDLDITFDTTLD